MNSSSPPPGLELEQDMQFQWRSWRVQRVAWVVLALILAAALAGLAGTGPLSRAEQASPDGSLRLEYERFVRTMAPSRLRFHFSAGAVEGGELSIWLDRAYLEQMLVEHVVPPPQRVEIGAARLTYTFAVENGHDGLVTFHLQPRSFGRLSGRAGTGAEAVEFTQLVYP